jgi:hypothetical protein
MVGTPSINNIQRHPGHAIGFSTLINHPASGPPQTADTGTASMNVEIAPARYLAGIHCAR